MYTIDVKEIIVSCDLKPTKLFYLIKLELLPYLEIISSQ